MNEEWEYEDDEVCYECSGLGDDYYIDEDGELVCRCYECSVWMRHHEVGQ